MAEHIEYQGNFSGSQIDTLLAKIQSSQVFTTEEKTKLASLVNYDDTEVKEDISDIETSLNSHKSDTTNPHQVTKTQVGLGNVDNTSDANKPISTATQAALNNKVNKVDGKGLSTNDFTNEDKAQITTNKNNILSIQSKTAGILKSNDTSIETTGNAVINISANAIVDLSDKRKKYSFNMEIGGIDFSGGEITSPTRTRTKNFIPCNELINNIHFPQGTKHKFVYYSNNNTTFVGMSEWSTATEDNIVFPSLSYDQYNIGLRILCGYQDDKTITNDKIPNIWFEYNKPSNNIIKTLNGYSLNYPCLNSVVNNTDFILSSFIPVEAGKSYKATKFRNTIFYDSTLTATRLLLTSQITNNTITANDGEAFVCFCWRKTDVETMCFAEVDKFIQGDTIENLVPLPLKGKKLSLLGDSISSYAGTIPTENEAYYTGNNSGVSDACQMWWNVLCSRTGMIPLVINGWSGSGITQLTDSAHSGKTPMSATSRCQALNVGTTTPDIILIAGGVNDYTYAEQSSQVPSDWDGSTAPINGNSFDETYAVMIKNIQTAYPNTVVVCLSTWFTMRGTDNGYTLVNGEGLTQADYDKAIEKVAKLMRVPFISVDTCGFSRSNFYPTYAEDSSTIPTHPNKNGQKVMGEYLANVLPEIVKGFVG